MVGASLVEAGDAVEYGQELILIEFASAGRVGGLSVFRKVLIANRGEIALRILRGCRELGAEAVVAYSEADRDSLPVQLADEAICIGPADARRSYLSAPAVISAALVTGCDAIHPGYGFLSEDEGFAEVVAAHGLTFIGPPAAVLERFASKAGDPPAARPPTGCRRSRARRACSATRCTRSTRPSGSATRSSSSRRPAAAARACGWSGPARELESVLRVCRSEAKAAFGDDSLYLEKWLDENRHVEVQVAIDRYGHGVHLGERDCSVQRRHQKILEEAPDAGPRPTPPARDLAERAVRAAVAAGYENVGTLEFLVDAAGDFYFIEINCRIQVEHPVTEMLTGLDLVATQIRIAAGEPLGLLPGGRHDARATPSSSGSTPRTRRTSSGRAPASSSATTRRAGPGVRMDSHLYSGYEVPPYYDSLLGKLIVWGPDRATAIARGRVALDELVVDGLVDQRRRSTRRCSPTRRSSRAG